MLGAVIAEERKEGEEEAMYRTGGIGSLSYKLRRGGFCPHDPTQLED